MRSIEPNTHTGNTMLTITGEKFGRDASAVEVHFIDTEESHCDVRSVSDTVIECYLTSTPAGVRRQVSVKIGNAGKQYNRSSHRQDQNNAYDGHVRKCRDPLLLYIEFYQIVQFNILCTLNIKCDICFFKYFVIILNLF